MSDIAKRITDLSPDKLELLLRRTRKTNKERSQIISPQKRVSHIFPLSFAEQRIWFLEQWETELPPYNISLSVRLTGTLFVEALEQAVHTLVKRHETLRTTFTVLEEEPVQVVAPALTLSFPILDLAGLAKTEQEKIIRRLAVEESRLPFDLTSGPLLRLHLLRLGADRHLLLLTMHHIISDGWSLSLFVRELAMLYNAFSTGKPSPLPALNIQYADFTLWQRDWLTGKVLEQQLAYWKEQLRGAPAVLELPTDHPRPPIQGFRGASYTFALSPSLSEALQTLSNREGVTLFMALLAAFQILLFRYTQQEDIPVGSPIANRTRSDIEHLIGCFINTLVLRSNLSGNPTFKEVMQRVRDTTLGAYAHQDLPFEKLVEELQPERSLSHTPLFQVMFILRNAARSTQQLPGLTIQTEEIDNGATKFDITLTMTETRQGLIGTFEYRTDLFEAATITRMTQHFQELLRGVASQPEQRISSLPLLTAAEQQKMLVDWNTTQTAYPHDTGLHHLFEAQADRTPEATALLYGSEEMTYRALNEQANQLAHYLRRLGVGPETRVGLCLERSPLMLIGVLAILKAAGAFVPIDPTYPSERLTLLLTDAQISLLLTQEGLLAVQKDNAGLDTLYLDTCWQMITGESKENPTTSISPENLAYIIYTSGSTGRPKGVMIPHRGLTNYLHWCSSAYDAEAGRGSLVHTPLGFDLTLTSLLAPLLKGQCVILLPETGEVDALATALHTGDDLSLLKLTPAHLEMLSQLLPGESIRECVRTLIIGGEALLSEHISFWRSADPRTRLINEYGPTETVVGCCVYEVPEHSPTTGAIPIGRPIANTQLYVLDAHIHPLPMGVPGELYIGGDGLARGYFMQPDVTAERFVPNPFSQKPGQRLYKTGDVVRYRSDGVLEYLGRNDHQVKLRGYRIESGEIESTLRQHEAVQDALVLLREDQPGDKQLVAYAILHEEAMRQAQTEGTTQQVQYWQQVFDDAYGQASEEPLLNLAGWTSSYTGLPIPAAEMREWVERTVERLLGLHPRRVLEIGCGTGLLLLQLAPYCTGYTGTDFSRAALGAIERHLLDQGGALPHVQLLERRADDYSGLEQASYDLVILNSVVQYFPTREYLLSVLQGALQVLKPGGVLFLGDVRHLAFLETFHTSVELHWAQETMRVEQLRQRIRHRIKQEAELLLDPGFFHILKQHFSQISHTEILLKRGFSRNELTNYRYDVLLYKTTEASDISLSSQPAMLCLDWQKDQLDLTQIRRLLQEDQPEMVKIIHVPNARLTTDVQVHDLLVHENEYFQTVADLRRVHNELAASPGVDPEEIWESCHDLPYEVSLHWSETDGSFEALYRYEKLSGTIVETLPSHLPDPGETTPLSSWQAYTTHPLQNQLVNQRVLALREHLKERLPQYMLPSVFVMLDQFPLTAHGKVDRRALPPPGANATEGNLEQVAPRNATEELLVEIWSAILGLETVGIHDNFFELGGHSLLAIRLISRLRGEFQIDLPLRSLFESSTIAALALTIQQLKGMQSRESVPSISWPTIIPSPDQRHQPFSLTDVQQAYWIGRNEAFELGNVATHVYIELETSNLDIGRLSRAWQRLIERHDMLRAIVLPDGQQQILQQVPPYRIPVLDLRGLDAEEVAARLEDVRQSMSHQMLPTDSWPLFELRASYLDQGRIRLHLSADALMIDAGSWQILVRELIMFYQNLDSVLPSLELSFRDYVLAERAFRSSEVYHRALEYWQSRLPTFPPAPDMPLIQNPARLSQPRFTRREARLEPAIWSRLKNKGVRAGLTPSALLLAAFAEVLTIWSKQPRFTINLTLFNRLPLHPQVNEIIGDFTSLTLLEVDNSSRASFVTRARRIQDRLWEDLDNRYVSGVYMLRELARTRESNTQAIMPVVFTSTLTQEKTAPAASPLGKMVYGISQTPQVWLDHQIGEQRGALTYNWDTVEELFPAGLLDEMFSVYTHFLHSLAETEESWQNETRQLVPLSQIEQRTAINDTTAPVPSGLLHSLFWEQVSQRPDQLAVIAPDQRLTYEELYRRSNQLGRLLRQKGAMSNTLIAIVMEKGWEQVVAALGILQSGAAYLPIDAALPRTRLWYLLEHGEVSMVLTQSWHELEWPENVQVYSVDTLDMDQIDDDPPTSVQRPEDLAYVIYTSGSTGLPKGVMIDHRGAVNTIVDINQRFGVGFEDRVLALSSLSFDLSVYDIFGLLAVGGTIVFPEATGLRDPAHWAELIGKEKITLWNTVPALMQMLAEYVIEHPEYAPLPLRLVLMSGDWISLPLPALIKDLTRDAEIISLGGATEASIWSILYPIHAVDPSWRSVPYGRPMVNQWFHVLSETMEPCPVWVPGRLYIGGIGLAQGYWRDEEKTQASFITHPLTGERLYHTGDLGRYLPDGNIEFLGREDFQVKIQGYRIELGEIEAALSQHPAIRAALVTVTGTSAFNRHLVAYLVLEQEITPEEVRIFLEEKLPAYMIPTSFMILDAFPLTANGKVDRKALPEPTLTKLPPEVKGGLQPFMMQISRVVADVLQVEQIDPETNLLDLGANSIDIVRIANALEKELNFRPRIADIFRSPMIVSLAQSYELYLHQIQAMPEKEVEADEREEGEI